MSRNSTIVIGAGVIGACTAYYLAKRGHRVTLVERGRIDQGASKGNAGIIALGHPPLPRPGLVWQTIKWMFDKGSPLYVPPRFDPALMAWMWRFHRACTPAHFEHCMRVLAELGWKTGALWDQLIDEERIECEYHKTGWLDVFLSEAGRAHAMKDAELLRRHGYQVDELSGDELRRREPVFRDEVIGAMHYTDSRFASPGKFVTQLVTRLKLMGVDVRSETEVAEVIVHNGTFSAVRCNRAEIGNQTSGISQPRIHNSEPGIEDAKRDADVLEADALVLAAGVWTTELARQLGVRVPMQAGKGYHVNLSVPSMAQPGVRPSDQATTPTLSTACVCNEKYVAVTPMNGGLRLAGTVELSGINHRLVQRRVDMLAEGARRYLRGIENADITTKWCGLRPCTADGLPVIDWAPHIENIFIATGHAKYGFAYGPVTGRLASECILDGQASMDITALNANRF